MRKKEIFTAENTENAEVASVNSVRSVVDTDDIPDGFQMTELGPLPKEWRLVRLGEMVQFQTGQREKGGARTDQGIISVGGEHITEDGQIDFISSPKYVSHEFFQNMITGKVNPGDILVVKDGARTGKSAFVRQVPPTGMAVNEHVFILRAHNKNAVEGEYVGFWFRSQMAWAQINSAYHGLIGGINRREITNFLLPLPPLPEQRAIAHVLRTVQRAKEATEGVIAALKDLKKSLMQHLFTYGPVPVTERERVALQESELGPLPAHWRVVRLGEVAEKTRQLDPCKTPDWSFKYVDVSSIDNESLRITRCQSFIGKEAPSRARKQIKFGDVLFATVRPYLKRIAMVPSELDGQICSTAFCVLRAKSEIDACYLFFAVSQESFVQRIVEYQRGSSYPAVTDQDLLRELIPLPPLDEQREIARIFQAVDARIAAGQARRAALEELFKTLLHVLMSARIRLPAEFVIQFEE